ncbi:MAG TPA: hypothetical protein VGB70_03235 [Allosphingosinicella sp.]|jgi:hypothetical protein
MLGFMLAAAAQLAQPNCPIDRQVYALRSDPRFTAGFARYDPRMPLASDLAFWLKTPKRTYWFSFHAPNGYGGTIIMPDLDPAAALRSLEEDAPEAELPDGAEGEEPVTIAFDAFRPDLSVYKAPPQVEDRAPARLFARELGAALWYNAAALARDPAAEAEAMPIGMFEPASCMRKTHFTVRK